MKRVYWILFLFIGFVTLLIHKCYVEYADLFERSNITELEENWIKREKEVRELKAYFKSIVPKNIEVYLEFKRNGNVDFWVTELNENSIYGQIRWFQEWNIDIANYRIPNPSKSDSTEWAPKTRSLDTILTKLNWEKETFSNIHEYLNLANCNSIENGEPSQIGFRRSGMGKYYYLLFDRPIPEEMEATYNDSCQYVIYNNFLVFEYGGGAIGSQCFPDF